MDRTRFSSIAIVVWTACAAASLTAQTPAPADGWVVLPVDEYRALRDRANPSAPAPPAPAVDATLTRIDYDLRVDADSISGRALLTIDVMKDGWSSIQIPAGLKARDARLDGQPVPLIEGAPPRVLVARAGRSVLTLDIAMPLTTSAGVQSIAPPPPPPPIARVPPALPKSGVDPSPPGGVRAEQTAAPGRNPGAADRRPPQ